MSEYQTLLVDAYKGEIFGDAFFAALADAQSDPQRAEKLRALQRIEERTAAMLKPMIAADVELDEQRIANEGKELAAAIDMAEWHGFLRGLHDALPGFLAGFVRCRELAPNPADPALGALVAHEQTISAFTELELAGHEDLTLALLERYLESAP